MTDFTKDLLTPPNLKTPAYIDLLAIVILYSMGMIISNPAGNFPLNDDWAYALSVYHLLETGEYRPVNWAAMSLLSNVAWGAMFCLPFDCSFYVLRISTITLSVIGVLGIYLLNRELQVPRWISITSALLVAFNPIYWALSNTFMTDVAYMAFQILSALFLVRHLNNGSMSTLLAGTIFALVATLSRQTGIAIPLAFAFTLTLRNGINGQAIARAAIPLATCITALFFYQQWLSITDQLPLTSHQRSDELKEIFNNPEIFFYSFSINTYISLIYLGIFLLPILIIAIDSLWKDKKTAAIPYFLISIAIILCGFFIIFDGNFLLPILDNTIVKSGIGPLTLRDTYILGMHDTPELPYNFWLITTCLAFLGACIFLTIILSASKYLPNALASKKNKSFYSGIFLLSIALVYFAPLLTVNIYDRYIVQAIPFITTGIFSIIISQQKRIRIISGLPGAILIICFAFYAIFGTKDYMTWNRARWIALEHLMSSQESNAKKIDGGFEFNGLYLYDKNYQGIPNKSWWWVQDDTFVISFQPIHGYKILREYSYWQWLTASKGRILVLEKIPTQ